MARTFSCSDGTHIRADSDDELVATVERHLRAAHPEQSGRLSRREILALATDDATRFTRRRDPMTAANTTARPATLDDVQQAVTALAERFAAERKERQQRRTLDPADFDRLAEAGFPLVIVPTELGGLWDDVPASTRPAARMLRTLARGDPSVALVASMHPAVLAFWVATPEVPEPHAEAWRAQRHAALASAAAGAWWGTITSEPGSGGDIARTRAAARPVPDADETQVTSWPGWRITGPKHFGSGTGITSYMFTTAVPEGEEEPDLFFLDMRGVPLDGTRGARLIAEWDGHGMTATQSHAISFHDYPATRLAWPGHWRDLANAAAPLIHPSFAAVILGIVDSAVAAARNKLTGQRLRAYEQVEWTRAQTEAWLADQALEGMLRAAETATEPMQALLTGKVAIAELAESALGRICRVLGGGTFSRSSPFGHWFEDVRALGYLRPPWGLAFDALADLDPINKPTD